MAVLPLHDYLERRGARFAHLSGVETVLHFGDARAEWEAMRQAVGLLDLSARGRLCLTGTDRQAFLHGQVTNQVLQLPVGQGCYACLLSAKGKIQSDLSIFNLGEELLLDFEPGMTAQLVERLEQYVIADDVQIVDAGSAYGALGVLGPRARRVLDQLAPSLSVPADPWTWAKTPVAQWGELYCVCRPRGSIPAWDLYVPTAALAAAADRLEASVQQHAGRWCGWEALEVWRVESGLPRFGADFDDSNLPPEAGLESAISYTKGCYIGQEVIARLRTYGHVNKLLRGLRLPGALKALPSPRDRLLSGRQDAGHVTTAVWSHGLQAPIALGYVRRAFSQAGTQLTLAKQPDVGAVIVTDLPFVGADVRT